jgi:uncharacterized protein (DUF427 family)
MKPEPVIPKSGQESVWDYPRPPRLEPTGKRIKVEFAGVVIADTARAYRVLETSHPPVYYIPPDDIRMDYLEPAAGDSWCEWKGKGKYYDIVVGNERSESAAWYYPDPSESFAAIRDYVAFYAGRVDACHVDDEKVTPQPGGFYGGWITRDIVGPFKGIPGSMGW